MLKEALKKLGNKRALQLLLAVAFVLLVALGLDPGRAEQVLSDLTNTNLGTYRVLEVVDGDTIVVDMDRTAETIRMIGLDTPEKNHPQKPVQCFAREATENLKNLVGNSQVKLEADPMSQNRDRYSRLLRYVYLPDGTLLNAKQIEQGFAFAYLGFPFSKSVEFKALENSARQEGRGLWTSCGIESDGGFISTEPV